jgi:type II secretory pathway component PulF
MTLGEVGRFTRDLGALLRMAYDPPEAVARIQAGSQGGLRATLEGVKQSLLKGATLAQALGASDAFPDLVRRGLLGLEGKGDVIAALERLADILEQTEWRRTTIAGVLAYPRLLLGVAIVVSWLVVGPALHGLFYNAYSMIWSMPVPLPTRAGLVVSNFAMSGPGMLLVATGILGLQLALSGRFGLSRTWPMLPWVGPWMRRTDAITWCRWMDHLLLLSTPLSEAVSLAAEGCVSKGFIDRMRRASVRVAHGAELADALAAERALPAAAGWLVARAERLEFRSGALTHTADCLERSMVSASNDLMGVLEPLALMVIGALLGLCILAVFLPQYTLIGQLH